VVSAAGCDVLVSARGDGVLKKARFAGGGAWLVPNRDSAPEEKAAKRPRLKARGPAAGGRKPHVPARRAGRDTGERMEKTKRT